LLGLNQSPSVSRPTEGEVQVHFIDVGQGDCALILSQNTAVLIDSGDSQFADFVVDYIKRMGVTELDLIITSHPHADHIGGMAKIINNIGTKRLIMPDKAHDTNTFLRMLDAIEDNNVDVGYAKAGEVIDFGNFELQIIAPVIEFDSINDSSVAVRLVHGSNSFLFTGDMETKAEDDLLERKADVSADVLKVSHHGSRTSSQRLFLDAVNGDYAVISVAEGNIHNHPNDDVLRRLEVTGYRILRTDELGTIVFISNSEGLEVSS
jgi:beta-lactamase superfamily II metal-dependent hydrolase